MTPSTFFMAFSTAKPFSPEAMATTYQGPRSWTEGAGVRGPPSRLGGTLQLGAHPLGQSVRGGAVPGGAQRPGGPRGLVPAQGPASPAMPPGRRAPRPGPGGPAAQRSCSRSLTRQRTPRAPGTPVYMALRVHCGRPVTATHRSGLPSGHVTQRAGADRSVGASVPGPGGLESRKPVPANPASPHVLHWKVPEGASHPGQTGLPSPQAQPCPSLLPASTGPRSRPGGGQGRLVLSEGALVDTFCFNH